MVCVKNQIESSSCSCNWTTLHTPITPASEVALRLCKKQRLQSSQHGNTVVASHGQNLLSEELHEYSKICSKTEMGKKIKKTSSPRCSSQSSSMETKCVAALTVPPAQGDSLCPQTSPTTQMPPRALTCDHCLSHIFPFTACLRSPSQLQCCL